MRGFWTNNASGTVRKREAAAPVALPQKFGRDAAVMAVACCGRQWPPPQIQKLNYNTRLNLPPHYTTPDGTEWHRWWENFPPTFRSAHEKKRTAVVPPFFVFLPQLLPAPDS